MPIIYTHFSSQRALPDFAFHSIEGTSHICEDVALREEMEFNLSPKSLGDRLWSTYLELDERLVRSNPDLEGGTTASTTLVDKNVIITATLSDTVVFVAALDTND